MEELEELIINNPKEEKEVQEVEAIKGPKPGARYKAVVTRIVKGKYGDFFDVEKIRSDIMRQRIENYYDRTAFQIEFKIPELGLSDRNVILYSLHPKSNFVLLMNCYDGAIRVGQEVTVEFNGKYFKIVCPSED